MLQLHKKKLFYNKYRLKSPTDIFFLFGGNGFDYFSLTKVSREM